MEIGIGICFEEFGRNCLMHVFVALDTPLCSSGGRRILNFANSRNSSLLVSTTVNPVKAQLGWR